MKSPAGLENVIRGGSSEIYSIGKGYGKILARTSHAAHRAFMRRALGSIVIHSQLLPFQRFAGTHRVGSKSSVERGPALMTGGLGSANDGRPGER